MVVTTPSARNPVEPWWGWPNSDENRHTGSQAEQDPAEHALPTLPLAVPTHAENTTNNDQPSYAVSRTIRGANNFVLM